MPNSSSYILSVVGNLELHNKFKKYFEDQDLNSNRFIGKVFQLINRSIDDKCIVEAPIDEFIITEYINPLVKSVKFNRGFMRRSSSDDYYARGSQLGGGQYLITIAKKYKKDFLESIRSLRILKAQAVRSLIQLVINMEVDTIEDSVIYNELVELTNRFKSRNKILSDELNYDTNSQE